jgi:N-acetylglucosamine-6-phosphate deacetylase
MRLGVATSIVGGEVVTGDVDVVDGRIVAVGLAGSGKGVAIPGLVDLQVNGYHGVDVSSASPEELQAMGRALARDGVLWYQPTLVTAAVDDTRASLARIARVVDDPAGGARVLGAHLEGPFLAASRAGAHDPGHIREPSPEILELLLTTACPVTQVTLAPERPGALALVEELVRRRIVVSLGHSDADADAAAAGFTAGARAVTHLYNAMRPFWHRDAGLVGAALVRDEVTVTVIADGVHVAPEALLLAWRAARHRLVLVSDAIAAAGLGDGIYRLGPKDVSVVAGISRTWDGALAGATRPLLDGVRHLVSLGVPLPEAVAAATTTPAHLVGHPGLAALRPGGPADVLVLGADLSLRQVLVAGIPVD